MQHWVYMYLVYMAVKFVLYVVDNLTVIYADNIARNTDFVVHKLFKSHCNSGARSQFFAERVVKVWNSLPPTHY